MEKSKKRKNVILKVLEFLVLLVINFFLSIVFKKNLLYIIVFDIILILSIFLILLIVYIIRYSFVKYNLINKIRSLVIFILVAIISLLPALIINIAYKDSIPTEGELLTFYGEFIAFYGTFSLGFYIYKKDESHRIEDKKNKCKLLLSCIEQTELDMSKIRDGFSTNKINYCNNWRELYLEFESLTKRRLSAVKDTLNEIFDTADLMNCYLAQNEREKALKVYNSHISYNCYSMRKYNDFEAKIHILNATYYNEISFKHDYTPWDEKIEVNKVIIEYSKLLFSIVENYIYNYLVKKNINIIDSREFNYKIVDWLLGNPLIKKIANSPLDKRIITKIIFTIALKFDKESKKLSYSWAHYILK